MNRGFAQMTRMTRILRISATGRASQGKTSNMDTEKKRSRIRENNLPIPEAIIREIRVIHENPRF